MLQIGGPSPEIAEAERERWKAIADRDKEALLQANTSLIGAMLESQFGNVTFKPEASELYVEVRKQTSPSRAL